MVDLDDLLERAAARGATRGADEVWAAASCMPRVAASPEDAERTATSYLTSTRATRRRSISTSTRLVAIAAAVTASTIGAAVWHTRGERRQPVVVGADDRPTTTSAPTSTLVAPQEPTAASTVPSSPVPTQVQQGPAVTRLGVFGDSPAMLLGYGLATWAKGHPVEVTTDGTRLGCGLAQVDRVRIAQYGEGPGDPECDWTTRWPALLDARPLDLAVVYSGVWDLTDMTFDGDPAWHHVGDPAGDAHIREAVEQVAAFFAARGTRLALVLAPHIDFGRSDAVPPTAPYAVSDPTRVDHFNQILREVAAEHRNIALVDLPGYLAPLPGGEMDATARPDGVHLSKEAALALAEGGLGDELLRIAGRPFEQPVEGAPTVGVFGDSTGLMTGIGLQTWAFTHRTANVFGDARLGCGLVTAVGATEFPDLDGTLTRQPARPDCTFEDRWVQFLDRHAPLSLAVVQFGLQDLADVQLPGEEQWRHLGDPVFDAVVRERMSAAMAVFTTRAIPVVWLAAPHVSVGRPDRPPVDYPMNDPARIDRLNELLRQTAANNPAVAVVDLPGYLARSVGGEMDRAARQDGVHLSPETAEKLAADGLGDELLRHARP